MIIRRINEVIIGRLDHKFQELIDMKLNKRSMLI